MSSHWRCGPGVLLRIRKAIGTLMPQAEATACRLSEAVEMQPILLVAGTVRLTQRSWIDKRVKLRLPILSKWSSAVEGAVFCVTQSITTLPILSIFGDQVCVPFLATRAEQGVRTAHTVRIVMPVTDIGCPGVVDPEGIAYDEVFDFLYIIGRKSDDTVHQVDPVTGALVGEIDITGANAKSGAGLAIGPSSVPGPTSLWITDRGVDNGRARRLKPSAAHS